MTGALYNFDNYREPGQLEHMQRLEADGICIFCPRYFGSEHLNPIEFESDHWYVSRNDHPYEHTALHLLVLSKAHVSRFGELTTAARYDFTDLLVDVERRYRLDSYAFGCRNGDFRYNGASIYHLHAHVVVGDRVEGHKVRFPMSSAPRAKKVP